ncbi:xanthine dehydrogenase family protein molybdopterin-binding subunit [Salinigranum salinum]|uniref:xanthine dehydrogenase family protein molybdopterin-binding subunit n=1 Tax=Salinigranum salinum TaxID=1364937 RepID=UPI001260E33C|nr:xanthine dehydrogenase family protein molybdopterin-binding subunit [Salinigranum salinum]
MSQPEPPVRETDDEADSVAGADGTETTDASVTPDEASGSVGQRVNGLDGSRFVAGHGRYVDDIQRPNTLHAAFVRSPHAHAEIVDVDTTAAEAHPEVVRVWTAADVEPHLDGRYGYMLDDEEPLASDRAIYQGQEVVVVCAESKRAAREGVDLVEVTYDPLDAVTTIDDALADDAPDLHPEREGPTNVPWEGQAFAGDVDEAMADADVVVEGTFETNKTTPAPLEPHGCIAEYTPGAGTLTLWTSTQMPHLLAVELSQVFSDLDRRDITVKLPDVGGGFGIKLEVYPFEITSALLSMDTHRPVKHVLDRREEMVAGRGRANERLEGRLGVTADGEMVALDVDLTQNTGAFAAYGVAVGYSSMVCGSGPYEIENQRWDGRLVYTNVMPSTAVRGFGDPQATYMREQLVEMAAAELGMDAVELRLRNVPTRAEMPMRTSMGLVWRNADMPECLRTVREEIGWDRIRGGIRTDDGKLRGVGVGTIMKRGGNKTASGGDFDECIVKMNRDGDVTVLTAIASIGQGTETGIAQLVADTLGLPVDRVSVIRGDTDTTPEGLGVWADRGTIIAGSAAARAADDLRETLGAVAAHLLDVAPDDVSFVDGRVVCDAALVDETVADVGAGGGFGDQGDSAVEITDGTVSMTLDTLAGIAMRGNPETLGPEAERPASLQGGVSLVGKGKYQSQEVEFVDPETGRGNVAHSYTFGALGVVIDVDPTTGHLSVVDVAICEDVGNVINPKLVEGQIQGAIVQGLGESLLEGYSYDDAGRLRNDSLIDYHPPTMGDVPLVTKMTELENPDPTTSHGQKGVGECPLVPVMGAVGNALADATGERFFDLPFRAATVLPRLSEIGLRERTFESVE